MSGTAPVRPETSARTASGKKIPESWPRAAFSRTILRMEHTAQRIAVRPKAVSLPRCQPAGDDGYLLLPSSHPPLSDERRIRRKPLIGLGIIPIGTGQKA